MTSSDDPYLRITATGAIAVLGPGVTTIGSGGLAGIRLAGPGVSLLHAEITRHGPCAYITDLGSRDGTAVNGRPVAVRVLAHGDTLTFGTAACTAGGIPARTGLDPATPACPPLTPREHDILAALCQPARTSAAFITPAAVRDIAASLAVTDAAVKLHLASLYAKLGIPEGPDRRTKLANTAISLGLITLPYPSFE